MNSWKYHWEVSSEISQFWLHHNTLRQNQSLPFHGDTFFFRGLNLSGKVNVNFELMSMRFGSSVQFLLRRVSTPSYSKWVWYWKDDDGWKKYAKTKVDTILQICTGLNSNEIQIP